MNIFSVLDVSDNEEEVKVKPVKKAAKDTKPEVAKETKTSNAAPKAPKSKEGKPQQPKQQNATPSGPAAVDPVDAGKENTHGKHLGKTHKHGEKHHGKEGEGKKQPKRVFDRKSANGRGNEVSRGGRGKFGQGSVKQEAEDAEKHRDSAVPETEAVEETEGAETPVKEEVVDTTMSYEQFLRKREEARSASSLLAPAKATRVVDVASQFAGLKTVEEGEDTYIAPKVVKGTTNVKKDQRSTGKSQIDVAFKFESVNNDFRRRDDNRGARGDTRRPRTAGGKTKAPATVFNTGDFPSL